MKTEKTVFCSNKSKMTIGNTTYIITTHFKENARENAEDLLVKLAVKRIKSEMNSRNAKS